MPVSTTTTASPEMIETGTTTSLHHEARSSGQSDELLHQQQRDVVFQSGDTEDAEPGTKALRDPKSTPLWRFYFYQCLVAGNCFIVSCFASAYLFVAPAVQVEFGVSRLQSMIPFQMYIAMWGFGPLFLSPLSDLYGRRTIFLSSLFLWTAWHLGGAFAPNLATLVVTRTFAGLMGSASLTCGSLISTDVAEGIHILRGISVYSTFVFLGPIIGPIVGGFIAQYATPVTGTLGGWRWVFYAAAIAGAVMLVLLAVFLPETNRTVLLQRHAAALNKSQSSIKWKAPAHASLREKIGIVMTGTAKMVKNPIVLFVSLWQTTVLGILYLFFEAFPIVYGEQHGFTTSQVGLAFIGIGIGTVLSCIYSITLDAKIYAGMVKRRAGQRPPELRAYSAIFAAVLTAASLLWFTYTSYPSVHWIVSILASAFYGFAFMGVMLSTFFYTVEVYLLQAGAAFAALSLLRSIATSFFPLFGQAFFANLGPRKAGLILACIAIAEIAIPVVALFYGARIRGQK